jgi:Tfp pilus assembly protein FimV
MTTIGITSSGFTVSAFPAPASGRTRLRLTVRGRRMLAVLAALPAVVALSVAIVSGGGALASRDAGPADAFTTVTVSSGESLWSIAQTVAPEADPRDVVDAIVRLNALDSVTVQAGQSLAIPAEFAPGR